MAKGAASRRSVRSGSLTSASGTPPKAPLLRSRKPDAESCSIAFARRSARTLLGALAGALGTTDRASEHVRLLREAAQGGEGGGERGEPDGDKEDWADIAGEDDTAGVERYDGVGTDAAGTNAVTSSAPSGRDDSGEDPLCVLPYFGGVQSSTAEGAQDGGPDLGGRPYRGGRPGDGDCLGRVWGSPDRSGRPCPARSS